MLQARQIAMLDGRPVYYDCEGNLCVESDGQCLRSLTPDEKEKLHKVLSRIKATNLVESGGDNGKTENR